MAKRGIAETFLSELQEKSVRKSSKNGPDRCFLPCHLTLLEALAEKHNMPMPCSTAELRQLMDAAPHLSHARSTSAALQRDIDCLKAAHTVMTHQPVAAVAGANAGGVTSGDVVEEVMAFQFLSSSGPARWRPLPGVFVHNMLKHEQSVAENRLQDKSKQFSATVAAVRQAAAAVDRQLSQHHENSNSGDWNDIALRGMHAGLIKRLAMSLEDTFPTTVPTSTSSATGADAAPGPAPATLADENKTAT